MRTRSLLASLVLALLLLPASAHASTTGILTDWHLDTQTSKPATDCTFNDPDTPRDPCVYYTTPDVYSYDVGPYYHHALTLGNGRWGQGIAATNSLMAQRQLSDHIPQPQHMTVMAWVRHDGYPGTYQYIVGEGDDGAGCSKASWALYTSSAGLGFYISPTGQPPVLSPAMTAQQSANLWDGHWHMVAGTYDGSRVHLYVDGQQIGTGTPSPFTTVDYTTMSHNNLYMDGYYPPECAGGSVGSSHNYLGDLDEVRIYAAAMTPSELARMSAASYGDQPPAFVADVPVVHTTGADQVTYNSARVNGTVDDGGSPTTPVDPIVYRFQYGTTTAYGQWSQPFETNGTGAQTVHVPISRLAAGTTYHARLVAGPDEQPGEDITFTTPSQATLHFPNPSVTVGEGAGPATLGVQRTGDTSQAVTVHYATSDGTAQAGSDFTSASGTLSFAAGDTTKSIVVPITDDAAHESDETLTVSLSSPSANAALGSPSQAQVTITDNDGLPTTSIALDPATPSSDGTYKMPVKVTVTGSGHAPVETRCVLDPPQAPAAFADMPAGCPISGSTVSAPGTHKVYAASRDAAGTGALVSRTFTITQPAAVVHTTGADQITDTGARVNGMIDDHGDGVAYYVEYGTTTAYGHSSARSLSSGAGLQTVHVALTGLSAGTTYHARLVVPGSATSEDVSFTTTGATSPPPVLPTTSIALDPATPDAAGSYSGPVKVTVTGSGHAPVETRCVLDPPQAPASFAAMPAGCGVSGSSVSAPGAHKVYAASRDSAGAGAVVNRGFTIAAAPAPGTDPTPAPGADPTPAPEPQPAPQPAPVPPDTTIMDAPSGTVWTATSMFAFTSTVAGSTFECRADGGAFGTCSSPTESAALDPGPHTFEVRAIAPDGTADPTPASTSFTVGQPTTGTTRCSLSPVRFEEDDPQFGEWGCISGTGVSVCNVLGFTCVPAAIACPVGAECIATTTTAYSTADKGLDVVLGADTSFKRIDDPPGSVVYGAVEDRCHTGGVSDGCRPKATMRVIGSGQLLLVWCDAHRGDALGPLEVHPAQRRIDCLSSLEIRLAAPLATTATGTDLTTLAPSQGTLTATSTVAGTTGAGVTAARSRPRIAGFHRSVHARGPVTVHLHPNQAARRVLKRRHRLHVIVRLTFTPTGGRPQHRKTNVTLTMHAKKKCPKRHGKRTRCVA